MLLNRLVGKQCPLLCKEFIVDAWQLFYARVHGADAVLLIAAVLPDQDLLYLSKIAKTLGLAVLIEVSSLLLPFLLITVPSLRSWSLIRAALQLRTTVKFAGCVADCHSASLLFEVVGFQVLECYIEHVQGVLMMDRFTLPEKWVEFLRSQM